MDRIVRVARWLAATPAAQLLLAGLILTFAFPATFTGTFGRLIIFAGLGIGLAWSWETLPAAIRAPSPRLATGYALGIVAIAGLAAFWPVLTESPSPEWQTGDWGPQHAVLANLMPHMPGLDFPTWNHAVSTGDAPLELYPALTYIVTGHVAWLLGLEHDLPHAFMIVATFTHLGLALTTTALACRVAPRPVATVIGLFWLVDSGAISHGGTVGIFQWALLHSAFAHVWSMIAALAILSALARPRLGASITIWIATAISTAAHPAALITAATFGLGLAAVALLAGDVWPRRALAALGHLMLGVALGAIVWLPASARLLEYGQHYPNELFDAVRLVQLVMSYAMPMTAYSLIVYTSYLGMLLGPWTRRADVIFITVIGFAMLIGLCDATYLAFGFAPGKTVARLGAIRMMMLARPFVFAGAAWVIGALIAHVRAAWVVRAIGRSGGSLRAEGAHGDGARVTGDGMREPRRYQRLAAAAILSIFGFTAARIAPEYWGAESARAVSEAARYAADRGSNTLLEEWATKEAAQLGPGKWARALFQSDYHDHMHLTAKTGLPSFHLSPIPDLLLRERIETSSAESLARFNVRWVIKAGEAPTLGDESTQQVIGTYHIREIQEWDGKLARIEAGDGTVEVTRLEDDLVEIDVKASAPVLVALGMGYYPRWRARHASGAAERVYAMKATPDSELRVVAAWVAPGRTTFTCDGPLPSDGDGRLLSLLAGLLAAAGVIVWTRPRWRVRVLRHLARGLRWLSARQRRFFEVLLPASLVALIVLGFLSQRAPAGAVLVGSSGVRPSATVEARIGEDDWQECPFSSFTGVYRCEDVVSVVDSTANIVNDAPPSWPFITPVIAATPEVPGVEIRIKRELPLGGTYWLATSHGDVSMRGGDATYTFTSGVKTVAEIARGSYELTITTKLPDSLKQSIAIVRKDTLVPERAFLVVPPESAPAGIQAIRQP